MKAPQIQLYNAVFKLSQQLNYDTYDYLPSEGEQAPYPFVHVAEGNSSDVFGNKDAITGTLSQSLHVWCYAHQRAKFMDMSFNLEQELRRLTRLENYYVRLTALDSNSIIDNSTSDSLLHGVIQAEYRLT